MTTITLQYIPETYNYFILENNQIKTEEDQPLLNLSDEPISRGFISFLSDSDFGADIEKLVRERNNFYDVTQQLEQRINDCLAENQKFKDVENERKEILETIRKEFDKNQLTIKDKEKSFVIAIKNKEDKILKLERALRLATEQIEKLKIKNTKQEKEYKQQLNSLKEENQQLLNKAKMYVLRCIASLGRTKDCIKNAYTEVMRSGGLNILDIERKNKDTLAIIKRPVVLDDNNEFVKERFKDIPLDTDYNYCISVSNGQRIYHALRLKDGSFYYDKERNDDFMKLKSVEKVINEEFEKGSFWDCQDIEQTLQINDLQKAMNEMNEIVNDCTTEKMFASEINKMLQMLGKNNHAIKDNVKTNALIQKFIKG